MDEEGLQIVGPLIGIVAIVSWGSVATLKRVGAQTPGKRWPWIALTIAAAVLAWLIFEYDALMYAVSENGPDYYSFSGYMRYRDALKNDFLFVIAGPAYALLAAVLTLGAVTAQLRHGRGFVLVLAVLACVAVVLPVLVPALLSHEERGHDPIFTAEGTPYVSSSSSLVIVCFKRAVEVSEPDPLETAGPQLCLTLAPTPESRRLAPPPLQGPMPSNVNPSVSDIADALNRQRLEHGEMPDDTDIDGIGLVTAEWR
jgi:hypothetical protein